MSNMSYCRFTNTLGDLRECYENMDGPLSVAESVARLRLIRLCLDLARNYADEIGAACEGEVDDQAYRDALRRARDPAVA